MNIKNIKLDEQDAEIVKKAKQDIKDIKSLVNYDHHMRNYLSSKKYNGLAGQYGTSFDTGKAVDSGAKLTNKDYKVLDESNHAFDIITKVANKIYQTNTLHIEQETDGGFEDLYNVSFVDLDSKGNIITALDGGMEPYSINWSVQDIIRAIYSGSGLMNYDDWDYIIHNLKKHLKKINQKDLDKTKKAFLVGKAVWRLKADLSHASYPSAWIVDCTNSVADQLSRSLDTSSVNKALISMEHVYKKLLDYGNEPVDDLAKKCIKSIHESIKRTYKSAIQTIPLKTAEGNRLPF